ncbi:MAG: acyl-ACP desaturase [Polyangiaceae bacterium]|nr:acyl-ACP desaturase [Polyangiaceae bacterium]
MHARLYELYRTSFEKAERERRWSVFEDVPWDRAKKDVSESIVSSAETFFCMHAALPEFVARAMEAARSGPFPTWYLTAWAYEKSRHQLALSEWLARTGRRSRDTLATLEQRALGAGCDVPFATGRQLVFYGAIQEMASFVTYAKHREIARASGDECLRTIYDFLARDEIAHARFFEATTRIYLEEDREGTARDMAAVVERFVSPGELLLADYEERMLTVREASIDRTVFIQRVYAPLLKRLGVTRRELTLARIDLGPRSTPRPQAASPSLP